MCGIIGYFGDKNSIPILLEGLKNLEYRGYDSAGLCVIDDNKLEVIKRAGKIDELSRELEQSSNISGICGIAHTRWATHGKPNKINAHPHLDCRKDIAIVHNGIIENYYGLREILKKEGHAIESDTDSEILAHLVEKFYNGNLEDAVIKALDCVEGTFGLAVRHRNENKIIAARRSSPLVIGIGNGEMFVASDVTAILKHTRNVVYLNDDEIAVLTKTGYSVKDFNGKKIDKKIHEIKWTIEQIEKSGFKHFMLKEIFEQPRAIENVLRGRIKNNKIQISVDIDVNALKRIVIVACGTSWHSGLIGKYIIEKMTGIPVEVDYASEFRYRNPIVNEGDVVIAISQSGETADTLAAVKEAKRKNARTIGIVNVVSSSIARETDSGIYLHAGPEIGVASTKAFSCQIVALLLLALFIRQKKGIELDEELLEELKKLPSKTEQILRHSGSIRKIAERFRNKMNFLYLGRGINAPVALEGALKLKEISYIHAEGYPAAEMKHGPIALIDKNMPAFFIASKDSIYEKTLGNMEEVRARGGRILVITDSEDKKLLNLAEEVFILPKTREELSPIINTIPLQLFAYHVADLKGIDVDKPRNLAKSVTVE
jgi:glucosamine--fructose-6-phosphate aminotransferase (isomerizing)